MTKNDINSKDLSSHPRIEQHGKEKGAHGVRRVLLIQNESVAKNIYFSTLTMFGHIVDVANSSFEALAKLIIQSYDVIIIDVNLPDTSGIALSQKIREIEKPSKRAHIAVITECEHCYIFNTYSAYFINSCHAKFIPTNFLLELMGDIG